MINKLRKLFKSKQFYKKIGQSFTEYALILGLLGIVVGVGTSELYKAAKHNFYYGLLPTNQQNIDLPRGPNGEHGMYVEDYLGEVDLVCEIANKVGIPDPADPTKILYYEYYVEAGQQVYCFDNSRNTVRNNWSKKYQEITLSPGEQRNIELIVWDEYGIKYSANAVIKTLGSADASDPEAATKNQRKPIANIVLNPDAARYGAGSIINVSAASSRGLNGAGIEEYHWKISDVYLDEDNKKMTKVEDLPDTEHAVNVTVKITEDNDIEGRERGLTTEISSEPKANRYIRLRVKSNGVWSDWTQKLIYASDNTIPVALITSSVVSTIRDSIDVVQNVPFGLYRTSSYDPDYMGGEMTQGTYGKGIMAFQWRLYEKDASGKYNLIQEYAVNQDPGDANSLVTFTELKDYCFALRVQDVENSWSSWVDPNDKSIPTDSLKYVYVKKPNKNPDIGPGTVTVPTDKDNVITVLESDEVEITFKPEIIHPETLEDNYIKNYLADDYTFAEFYWALYAEDGSLLYEIAGDDRYTEDMTYTLPVLEKGEYTLKMRVQDKSGLWSDETDPDSIFIIKIECIEICEPTYQNFEYTGGIQSVTLSPGTYILEVWGAQGGKDTYEGGEGGYSKGTLTLTETKTLYVVVGGKGGPYATPTGGYNGGGRGGTQNSNKYGAGGGGATHIGFKNNVLTAYESDYSSKLLIVAGGGGGSDANQESYAGKATKYGTNTIIYNSADAVGHGGGTSGTAIIDGGRTSTPGTQTSGGYGEQGSGSFGKGGNGGTNAGGGGGGLYGGGCGTAGTGGAGGSGYVNKTLLTNTETIAGDESIPAPGGGTEMGHPGNGYARITNVKGTGGTNCYCLEGDPVGTIYNFPYTGEVQTKELFPGTYKLEVWGAQGGWGGAGGNQSTNGGHGGYSVGELTITELTTIYVYVGGKGAQSTPGYNGGGTGANSNIGGGGGGGTDIRLKTDSLYSRVIVAGGGGGEEYSGYSGSNLGGPGGGSSGIRATGGNEVSFGGYPGTQTAGGKKGVYRDSTYNYNNSTAGSFGKGGNGSTGHGGGGGGGWYGGGGGAADGSGAGGSGWIYTSSTYNNWKSNATEGSSNNWLLDSSYYLTNAQTIAGNQTFLSPNGTNETGHTGNGYARITVIGGKSSQKNYLLDNQARTWLEAKSFCESKGGHLATITSASEQTAIENKIKQDAARKDLYWLGGMVNSTTNQWSWITGETWSYTNWTPGEPTGGQSYLLIASDTAKTNISNTNQDWKWMDNPNDGAGIWSIARTGTICEIE